VTYLSEFSTRSTPQSEPIPGSSQVPNGAGGHAWEVDDWARLERFLILGSEGGSYYACERKLTVENAEATLRCIGHDGTEAVRRIVAVSTAGRAPKNDPAIFALALAAAAADPVTRRMALDHVPDVCRTGTHLFAFATYAEQFRGWGRGLRRAIADWYTDKDPDALGYQLVKYRQRGGWTHRDLLRLSKPRPARGSTTDQILSWAVGRDGGPHQLPAVVKAYERAQRSTTPKETAGIVATNPGLPREAVNPEHLTDPIVWDALLHAGMPMTALIRNLAAMSRVGLLTPMSEAETLVCEQISDADRLRKARVHPLAVLVALKTYEQGYSERSGQQWSPVASVIDALDGAFYAAFGNVTPTGKRTMLALDVSGSMASQTIAGMPGITPRVGSAAMALVTAAVEPEHVITAFSTDFVQLSISPRQRLTDVIRSISAMPFDRTDCSLPMRAAEQSVAMGGALIDTFIIYTDSETWSGSIHPAQALARYRQKAGVDAKLVVVGMVSNGFTIADPNDPGMLDVVGFDTATPNVIAEFATA
jgi:60 kDa SS-A/Ro ribonucleoprotein